MLFATDQKEDPLRAKGKPLKWLTVSYEDRFIISFLRE